MSAGINSNGLEVKTARRGITLPMMLILLFTGLHKTPPNAALMT
jgi:hypothetical protein